MHKTDGFPSSLAGKESACNAGDLGLISGSGRSTGDGIGYPLQYSWVSLVTQLVEYLQCGTPGLIPGLEDLLEKGTATHSSILAWRIHGLYSPQSRKELDTTEQLS